VCLAGLFCVLSFLIAAKAQADFIFMGGMRLGCSTAEPYQTPAKPGYCPGKSKTSVYLNLAQAIANANNAQSQGYPQGFGSSFYNVPAPKTTVPVKTATPVAHPLK